MVDLSFWAALVKVPAPAEVDWAALAQPASTMTETENETTASAARITRRLEVPETGTMGDFIVLPFFTVVVSELRMVLLSGVEI
jgi:hypothetical protein